MRLKYPKQKAAKDRKHVGTFIHRDDREYIEKLAAAGDWTLAAAVRQIVEFHREAMRAINSRNKQ